MTKINCKIIETLVTMSTDTLELHTTLVNNWLSENYDEILVIGLSTIVINNRLITTIHYKVC